MEHLIHTPIHDIQISGIRKIATAAARYPDALALTLGQPDFPTPAHIITAAEQAMHQGKTVYTPNAGIPALRRAAAEFVKVKYNQHYDMDTEVIVTVGASQALDVALRTIVSPGDEVILPGPIYPGYEPLIRLAGGVPIYVDTRSTGFKLTAELLEPHLSPRTKAIALGYPSNPTGRVLGEQELNGIADLLRERDIFIISDEIYSELIYDEPHRSISLLPGMREKTIVINGLSKSHSMTGWRIGFLFAPAWLSAHMLKVHQYNVSCASSISQFAAVEALTNGIDDALPMRDAYRQRRDYVYDRLVQMGLELDKPEGAFYLFPSIAHLNIPSMEFAMRLLEEEKVAVVPGDAFSIYGEGYIRLSYAYALPVLEKALDRLETFIRTLHV